jgi:hypothetical protein
MMRRANPKETETMRTDVQRIVLTALLLAGGPAAWAHPSGPQTPVAAAQEAPARPAQDFQNAGQVLDALEAADEGLRTFTSGIIYTTRTDLGGSLKRRTGEIAFAQEPAGDGTLKRRFAVRFTTHQVGERYLEGKAAQQAIAFDGRWLTEALAEQEQINRREIVAQGQDVDPFELGDGPFPPLPIGQRKDDILRRYDVRLVPATEGLEPDADLDPEDPLDKTEIDLARSLMGFAQGSVQLLLVPRRAAADGRFAQIRLWYKPDASGRLLPRMSRTVDASSKDVSIVQLMHPLTVNGPAREDLLTITAPEGWTVTETPLGAPREGGSTPGTGRERP